MKILQRMLVFAILLAVSISNETRAGVLTVSSSRSIVFPAGGDGVARIAIQFELTGLPEGPGRRIDEALFEWPLDGLSSTGESTFEMFPIGVAWTELTANTALQDESIMLEPRAEWVVESLDYERNGGGFVRFDATALVKDWTGGMKANHGVIIATPDLDAETLASQIGTAILTIRYGFR